MLQHTLRHEWGLFALLACQEGSIKHCLRWPSPGRSVPHQRAAVGKMTPSTYQNPEPNPHSTLTLEHSKAPQPSQH